MGFPFIAPLKKEIQDKLKGREDNIRILNSLSPFVMLSSAAVVVNKSQGDSLSIMNGRKYEGSKKGCVVANTTNVAQMYQTGKTLVGYDLDGNPIEVDGEANRRISTPIIQSMELDTDGNNNTLKSAKLDIVVFTLKQLEMFELFFLRPGMSVVLEWGWNTDILNPSRKHLINSKLFAKKNFKTYIEDFTKIFSHKDNAYKEAKEAYLTTLKDLDYDYDFMAGKVTGFSFSPEADGTYKINLDISAGNELQLWKPLKQAQPSGKGKKTSKDPNVSQFQSWVNKIAADLNVIKLSKILNEKDDKKEFFNWGVLNTKQEDTKYSKDMYISFRLILKILNDIVVFKESKEHLRVVFKYDKKGHENGIIPINSSPIIISTTTDFILPGRLPSIKVVTDSKKKQNIIIEKDKFIECPINGYSFNISDDKTAKKIEIKNVYDDKETHNITSFSGNLLNVFFNYDRFVTIFNQSYTQADVLNSLLSSINDNMFGLCDLQLGKPDDIATGGNFNVIYDRKLIVPNEDVNVKKETYRFKIGATQSIVKEFSFNMELDALAQAQALYSSQLAINAAIKEKGNPQKPTTEASTNKEYKSANFAYTPNADGYYSINAVEVALQDDNDAWKTELGQTLNVTEETAKNPDSEKEKTNMNEVMDHNFVKFKLNADSKTPTANHLIYMDKSLIQNQIPTQPEETSALTFLEISLAIDGMSGLSCGEYFHIDGVPEIYNQNGYFQITNTKQGLDESGWKTTIEAQYRFEAKKS